MPVPAGAAGTWLPTAAGRETLTQITVGPNGTADYSINVPQVANVGQFHGRTIIIRGPQNDVDKRLLCGELR
jgi:hypothetical protein